MYNYQIMSNSFGYIDIILLGMIAGFIILRLRSILGRKTGHQSKAYPGFAEKKFNMPKNIVKSENQNHEILEGNEKKEFLRGMQWLDKWTNEKGEKMEPYSCFTIPYSNRGYDYNVSTLMG